MSAVIVLAPVLAAAWPAVSASVMGAAAAMGFAAAQTMQQIAADPKHLGADIGFLAVLHTWGQNLHLHPHLHCVVPGGGIAPDGSRWVSCRPGFFLPVRVLSRLFRGKYLARLRAAFDQGKLQFGGQLAALADPKAFARWLTPLYRKEWVVYAKRPFGGPAQVLKYLARYTHRVAISNSRLVKLENGQVTFRYKDYADASRHKTMTLSAEEFLRRFVQHVLPRGFVKIRHYGLLANRGRADKLHLCRCLLLPLAAANAAATDGAAPAPDEACPIDTTQLRHCPHCGGCRLVYIELPKETTELPKEAADTS